MLTLPNGSRLLACGTLAAAAACNGGLSAATVKKSPQLPSGAYIFEGTWGSLRCLDSACERKEPIYLAHVHGTLTFGDTFPRNPPRVPPTSRPVDIALTGNLTGDDRYRSCAGCPLDSLVMDVTPPSTATVGRQNGEVASIGFAVRVVHPYPPHRPRPPEISFLLTATPSGDFEAKGTGFGPIYLRKQRERVP